MRTSRYATSRQKACQQCVEAKARCDRSAEGCTRCAQRGLLCTYPQSGTPKRSARDRGVPSGESPRDLLSPATSLSATDALRQSSTGEELRPETEFIDASFESSRTDFGSGTVNTPSTAAGGSRFSELSGAGIATTPLKSDSLDFSYLELICTINVDDIRNRWLNPYIPVPGQTVKNYPAGVTAFIYRVFKSYAAVATRGRGVPPFVHPLQMTTLSYFPPLAACLSLVRIAEKPLAGSEVVSADVLQREMGTLYEQHTTYDDTSQLAAFQAYLIYSMVLFFQLGQTGPILRQAMVNLQEIACASSRRGLVCLAEQQRARPRRESWLIAEAKRRTLFVMYMFDSVLSAQDGLPTFLGTELRGLPAPASKALWEVKTRQEWETAYNVHLADWVEGGLHIDELWPVPPGLDEEGIAKRRSRVDQWLQGIDEFGTMLYAVTSCTHDG